MSDSESTEREVDPTLPLDFGFLGMTIFVMGHEDERHTKKRFNLKREFEALT